MTKVIYDTKWNNEKEVKEMFAVFGRRFSEAKLKKKKYEKNIVTVLVNLGLYIAFISVCKNKAEVKLVNKLYKRLGYDYEKTLKIKKPLRKRDKKCMKKK